MAASSGFRCSPGHAASGDVACIASTPPHGHRNGLNLLNLLNCFDGGIGTNMRKAAHPSGGIGIGSSNPRRWRGERLHHRWWCLVGDLCLLCGFWLVTRQPDTSYLCFRCATKWATQACTIPPQAAWVHQIHAAGGASGSTTMVMVVGRWFLLCVWVLTHDFSVWHVLPTTF
jgi:hypothetical protein